MINVVLFEPEIPQNTGNIMRTCVATNSHLHLIKPLGFKLDDNHMRRCAVNYLENLNYEVYENWDDFKDKNKGTYYYLTRYGKKPHTSFDYSNNKENTLTRVTEEVKNLILELDEKINNNNYETNKELIEKIQDLLDNNPEIKDSIDEELLTKFEDVKTSVNDYDIDNNKTFVKIVSIVLVVVFSALIFWIFKKEEK